MRLSVRAGFANAMTPIQPRVAHLSTSAADFKNGQLERLARAATAAAPVREEKRLSPIGNFFLFFFPLASLYFVVVVVVAYAPIILPLSAIRI